MNTSSNQSDELHDQLIDLALREAVGEESPPDLSERILAAASAEDEQQVTLPARRTHLVLSGPRQILAQRKVQVSLVAAASLLLLANLTVLRPQHAARQKPRGELAQVVTVEPQPVDEIRELGDLNREAGQDSSGPASGSKLVMGVTPRVLVQEQPSDGELLDVKVQPTPGVVTPSTPKPTSVRVPTQKAETWDMQSIGQTQPSEHDYFSFSMGLGRAGEHTAGATDGRAVRWSVADDALQVAGSESGESRMSEMKAARQLAEQQSDSPVVLERIVSEKLQQDPMIASYRVEEQIIKQQIQELKNAKVNADSMEILRRERALNEHQLAFDAYRRKAEKQLSQMARKELLEHLLAKQANYDSQEKVLKVRIATLEQKDKQKLDEMNISDGRTDELALLRTSIGQLQVLKAELETKLHQLGQGPGKSGDKYDRIYENPFIEVEGERAVSTFSIDVDTASYANVRQFLLQSGQLPPPDAVRIEELVNYFPYHYSPPTGGTPFAAHVEVAGCPWNAEHRLVRVGLKGREVAKQARPQSNLVFLLDVSGSMDEPMKLPLLVEGMKLLTRELGENDRVAIVVYASSEGLALPSTRGDQQDTILAALEKLRAGGSTAGGAGIQLAYQIAKDNFIEGGVNRVILATDGDFNVGVTSPAELETMAETKAKETGVFLTVLGFGRGNLNDAMMEKISGKGNGNYHYIDNLTEARKVLVEEMSGTLVTIAKDVKIQIEFNPTQASAYRLIGYENRILQTQDFNDDKKDAGEIGAGHTVTAIYEVVPAGKQVDTPAVDPLKYQASAKAPSDADSSGELLTLKLRYKQPDGEVSTKVEYPVTDEGNSFAEASADFKFASSVASFGMLLRDSQYSGTTSFAAVKEIAQSALGKDELGYRGEFVELVQRAKELAGE